MVFTRQDALDFLNELTLSRNAAHFVRLKMKIRYGDCQESFAAALEVVNQAMVTYVASLKKLKSNALTISADIDSNKHSKPHYHDLNSNNKWRLK